MTDAAATVPLGSVTEWLSGGTPDRAVSRYWAGTIPWISAATLRGTEVRGSDKCVTVEAARIGSKMAPIGSTLVLVRGMALHHETRAGFVTTDVCFNQDVKALVPRKGLLPKFLTYSILARSWNIQNLVTSAGSGTGVLDTSALKRLEIWVPPLAEQSRIAEALSDADELIVGLERLIAKKQAIKQGMMQQLLTGRTRLPGFGGTWSPVRLGDVGSTYAGLSGKTKEDFGTGSAVFVTFMEVIQGARLSGTQLESVNVLAAERQNRVARGDVLFNGSSETPEEVALAAVVDYEPTPQTYLNSFCFGYRVKDRQLIDPTYLAYLFRSSIGREMVSALAQGATRYNIDTTKLMLAAPETPPIPAQLPIIHLLHRKDKTDVGGTRDAADRRATSHRRGSP